MQSWLSEALVPCSRPSIPNATIASPRQRVFARGQVPIRVLIPNIFTLLGLCAGLDGDPHGDRASLGSDRGGARVRGVPRRHRRPHRAAVEGLVALRRRARLPRRLRQFRRGAGHHHVQLGARRSAQHGLDRRARVRRLRRRSGSRASTWRWSGPICPPGRAAISSGCRRRPAPSSCCCRSTRRISACICRASRRSCCSIRWPSRCLMVSRVPTFSGKLIGQRIAREYVPPVFVLAALFIALLADLSVAHAWPSAR